MNRFTHAAFALCLILFASICPGRAEGPLALELRTISTRPSTIQWIDAKLTSISAQLLEGNLELDVSDDHGASYVFRTQELALSTGTRGFRITLPPGRTVGWTTPNRKVRARFIGKEKQFDLGEYTLSTSRGLESALVLGVGRPDTRTTEGSLRIWQSLRMERFAPQPQSGSAISLGTSPVQLQPEEFPTDSLTYCAFDVFLLEAGVFGRLKEKQVQALGEWLAAGGSVCVIATDRLGSGHSATLQKWVGADPSATRLEFDGEGVAIPDATGRVLARVGVGRLAVVTKEPVQESDFDQGPWRHMAAFLWKARFEQVKAIEAGGAIKPLDPARSWRHPDSQIIDELISMLVPQTVRVIPLSVIVSLLVAFIITVGPLDYFVLKKLGRRILTWVAFPVVSIAFTVATMKLASVYLGTNTHRGDLVITDLGVDGTVLRRTRCQLILTPKPEKFRQEFQHALVTPMANRFNSGLGTEKVVFEGLFPARYSLELGLQQWAPQSMRLLSFAEGTDDSRVNWSAIAKLSSEALEAAKGDSNCSLALLSRNATHQNIPGLPSDLLSSITVSSDQSNSIFSQKSPTGAGQLDDLTLIENDDPDFAVVAAVRREGNDVHIWRRLYPKR